MKKISKDIIIPSAVYAVPQSKIKFYKNIDVAPKVGDVVYGSISRIGQHRSLENKNGRIHNLHGTSKAIFVFGNRYAPDYYEGLVPDSKMEDVDLMARSGVVGIVKNKSPLVADPTRVNIFGYVCDEKGKVINTKDFSLIKPKKKKKSSPRSKMILVCGTAMNSGKSTAATAACWTLSTSGYHVRASKVTGTAGLKDILHMNDAGAKLFADFSYLGYPSTYMIDKKEILNIFDNLDLKFANNPKNYWVVELADGISQRETAMLLKSRQVKSRIHKLIFCANDAFGAIGGLQVLKDQFGLKPDAISGLCSSSPLHIQEIKKYTDIPIVNNMDINISQFKEILTCDK